MGLSSPMDTGCFVIIFPVEFTLGISIKIFSSPRYINRLPNLYLQHIKIRNQFIMEYIPYLNIIFFFEGFAKFSKLSCHAHLQFYICFLTCRTIFVNIVAVFGWFIFLKILIHNIVNHLVQSKLPRYCPKHRF